MKITVVLILVVAFFYSCNRSPENKKPLEDSVATVIKPPKAEGALSQRDSISGAGQEILSFLKTNNYEGLTHYFSEEGVVFSPYGFIDTVGSKRLSSADFLTAIRKNWILTWGSFDGTGEPIKLTVAAYLQKFVYNADFLNAEAESYNQVMKQGNSVNNLREIFPNAQFVEYHFSGFDPKYKGMDWTSLRLVFEKENDDYYLVAIVHDQWTI